MPSFSNSLEKAIHSALREANERKHELSTLEHFLFALLKEPDARLVLQACDVDLHSLEKRLFEFIEEELGNLVTDEEGAEAVPTAAFQRVIQRAAIHVTSSGRTEVRGGNVLVSIFAERESNAAFFLQEENLTRSDAVNFIAHGTAKNPEFEGAYDLEQPPKDETEELLTEAEWRARFEQEVPTSRVPRVAIVPKNDPFAFLSYSNKDGDLIEGVQDLLAKSAVSTWWDRDIAPGTAWRPEIAKRLETARVVVTFWTANSVASKPVIEEAATAQTSDKLVHIRLDDSPIPYGFGETQYVDLRDWDGSATHPNFQRVIFAIQDKLGAQTIKFASSRIASSSLLDVVAADGLLTVKDAPANVAPVVVDPSDLEHRLSALRQTMGSMCKMCADNTAFQLPQTLHHCLDALKTASELEPVTWYALEDAKLMLLDCMADSYAKDTWNTTIYKGLCTLMVRVDEIRPLLQPAQVVPGTQTQRPPAPEPKIRESEVAEVADVAEEISEQFQSDEGREVLDEALQNVMQSTVGQIRELNTSGEDTERKLHKMRRILKGLAYVTGGLVGAVGTGVVVNLLTAPAAAGTLLTRLQPLYEAILKFFV